MFECEFTTRLRRPIAIRSIRGRQQMEVHVAETDASGGSTPDVDHEIDSAARAESNFGPSVRHSPLGREVGVATARRIWWGVLVFAVLSVGILQQRVETRQAFHRDRYLVALVLSVLVAVVVWATLRFLLRLDSFQSIASTAVFMLLFFRWHLLLSLSSQLRLEGIVADLFVVAIAAITAIVLLSRSSRFLVIGGAVLLAVGGFLIAISSYLSWMLVDTPPMVFVETAPEVVAEGDIAVILLDAYLREDQLLELMDFDNSQFRHELENRGFLVDSDAQSNYNLTYGSAASMMALDHPIDAGEISEEEHKSVRNLLGGGGPFFQSFHDAGFEVTSHVNGWRGSRCSSAIDHCIRDGIVASTAFYMAEITPFAAVVKSMFPEPLAFVGMQQLRSIGGSVDEAFGRGGPQIVWEHISLPHPPLNYDAQCVLHNDAWRQGMLLSDGSERHWPRVVAYTEQIECVNVLVLEQIDAIISSHPESTILLVSDHGPRSQAVDADQTTWTERQLDEYFSIITAIRSPLDCDDVLDGVTIVNAFRRFVGCTLDIEMQDTHNGQFLLPDLGNPRSAFDVTRVGQ